MSQNRIGIDNFNLNSTTALHPNGLFFNRLREKSKLINDNNDSKNHNQFNNVHRTMAKNKFKNNNNGQRNK